MPPGGSSNVGFQKLLAYLKQEENGEAGSQLISHLSSKQRVDKSGFSLSEGNKKSINLLISLLVNKQPALRKEAATLLQLCLNSEDYSNGPPRQIFDDSDCEKLETVVFPALLSVLRDSKDPAVLEYWDILIKLLGLHIHAKTRIKLLNSAMLVVQVAFKCADVKLVERALKSWVVLMRNFALSPEILNAPKRVGLLVRALKYTNTSSQDETTYRLRIECWIELMYLLGKNVVHHTDLVVKEFLIFCFGNKSVGPEAKPSINSPSRTPGVKGFTPTKPMSPAKKFASLERICLDALVQMFAPRPLPTSLPKPCFSRQLGDVVVTPQGFGEVAHLVFDALQSMTENVKYTNRSEVVKVQLVWAGCGALLNQLTNLPNHLDPVLYYMKSINNVAKHLRRQEKQHNLLFQLVQSLLKFPDKILLSRVFSQTALEKKVTPVFFVYNILLQEPILNSKEETKGLHDLFDACGHKVFDHTDLIEILQRMEMVASHLSFIGLENLSTCWVSVCKQISSWQHLHETKGVSKTFSTIQQFLRFGLQHLPEQEVKFWREWGTLYTAMASQAELTVGIESGKICDEMTENMIQVYKGQEGSVKSGSVLAQVRCLQVIISNLIFPAIAREKKEEAGSFLQGFKHQLSPLGNATKAVQHLNQLATHYKVDNIDTELVEMLLNTYTLLINRVEITDLTMSVIKLVISNVCSFLDEESLRSLSSCGLFADAMKLFDILVKSMETKFSNSKDVQLLQSLEDFFIMCFQSKRSHIKHKISEVWTVTFSTVPSEEIPSNLKNVLKQCTSPGIRTQVSSDSQSGDTNSFPSTQEFLGKVVISEPGIQAALKNSAKKSKSPVKTSFDLKDTLATTSPARKSPRKLINSPGMKPPKSGGKIRLEDEDSCQFVKIQPKSKSKRVLTDHQKDRMTSRRDDIPALYSELSRDDSIIHLPSQFMTQPSIDESSNNTSNMFTKTNVPSNDKTPSSDKDKDDGKDKVIEDKSDIKDDEMTEPKDTKETSASQSLLTSPVEEVKPSRKARGRPPRKSVSTPQSSTKRKRPSVEITSDNTPSSKKTRKQITKEVFGSSGSSLNDVEIAENTVKSTESNSVEILSEEAKTRPETIEIESDVVNDNETEKREDTIQKKSVNEKIEEGTTNKKEEDKAREESARDKEEGTKEEKMEEIPTYKEETKEDNAVKKMEEDSEDKTDDDSQDDEIIENSQKPEVDDKDKRRSRRSFKKQKSPAKSAAKSPSDTGVDSKKNKFGETALFAAAKKDDLDKCKALISEGANPNLCDAAGWYPLHEISISRKPNVINIMQLLIEAGADVNCDKDGITPLNEAVMEGCVQNVEILLKAGAKPECEKSLVEGASNDKEMMDLLAQYFNVEQKKIDDAEEVKDPVIIQETADLSHTVSVLDKIEHKEENIESKEDKIIEEGEEIVNKDEDTLNKDGNTVKEDKETVNKADNTVNKNEVIDSKDEETVNNDDNTVNKDKESVNKDNESVNKDEDTVNKDDESVNKDEDTLNKDDKIVSNDDKVETKDDTVNNIEDDVFLQPEKSSNKTSETLDNNMETTEDRIDDNVERSKNSVEERYLAETDEIVDDEMNSSLLNSSAASDISGVTELDKQSTQHDDKKVQDVDIEISSSKGEAEDKATNEVANKDNDTEQFKFDRKVSDLERRISPESNKENRSGNRLQNTRAVPTLKDRTKLRFQSRVESIINSSSKKSDNADAEGKNYASPSSSTNAKPWSKFEPSPSSASPSASILKRKRTEDTPSSAEGSPVTGRIRHVHFSHDPVTERVIVPRTYEKTPTRKKLRLNVGDQDFASYKMESKSYEQTPPMDVSSDPIVPTMMKCTTPVKDLILQLATLQSTKILERDLKFYKINTVGDLAAKNPAEIRNIGGIKPPKEMTVKGALLRFKKTNIFKKSPVMEITTKEEEEKIKEALFNGPSPSPTRTSPHKNDGAFPSPPSSSEKTRDQKRSDPWEAELDTEEPLSVRAKRLSKVTKTDSITESKTSDADAEKQESFKFVKSDSIDNTENRDKQTEDALTDKQAALKQLKAAAFKEIGFGTKKDGKVGESEAMETTGDEGVASSVKHEEESTKVEDKSANDEDKFSKHDDKSIADNNEAEISDNSAKTFDNEDKSANTDEDKSANDVNDGPVNIDDVDNLLNQDLSALSKETLMNILSNTCERQQQLALLLNKVTLALHSK